MIRDNVSASIRAAEYSSVCGAGGSMMMVFLGTHHTSGARALRMPVHRLLCTSGCPTRRLPACRGLINPPPPLSARIHSHTTPTLDYSFPPPHAPTFALGTGTIAGCAGR
jgi:hypothetical protein